MLMVYAKRLMENEKPLGGDVLVGRYAARLDHDARWMRRQFKRGHQLQERSCAGYSCGCHRNWSAITLDNSAGTITIQRGLLSAIPIYYHIASDGGFYCSTRLDSLRRAGLHLAPNEAAMPEFFAYRFVMPPTTLCKDILQVPCGSRVVICLKDRAKIAQTDMLDPAQGHRQHDQRLIFDLSAALREAIAEAACGNEPVRLMFSGGLDSTILAALSQRTHELEPLCSCGFAFGDSGDAGEKHYAATGADALSMSCCWHNVTKREFLFSVLRSINDAEQPIHHLQTALVSAVLESRIPAGATVMSGLGADGIFGTDMHGRLTIPARAFGRPIAAAMSRSPLREAIAVASFISRRGGRLSGSLDLAARGRLPLHDPRHLIWDLGRYGRIDWIKHRFGVDETEIIAARSRTLAPYADRNLLDLVSLASFVGNASVTQGIWSAMASARGRRMIYPFVAESVLDIAFATDWSAKLRQPKNLLRQVAACYKLPQPLIDRPKKCWGIPPEKWAPPGAALQPLVPLATGTFETSEICKMQTADHATAMTCWNIINYNIWKRLVIDGEPLSALEDQLAEELDSATDSDIPTAEGIRNDDRNPTG